MLEVYKNLWVGSEFDLIAPALEDTENWAIVHAAKEPFHRKLLGYTGRSAPKDHPEYYIARRDKELTLNLIDAPDPKYIPNEVINVVLQFIAEQLQSGKKVFVHCNQGMSRGPSIALLYLAQIGYLGGNAEGIMKMFTDIYPLYNPSVGMKLYVELKLKK